MKPLPPQDQRHLEAAEGWLGLGNWYEANEELEQITPNLKVHPSVLELHYKIYSKAKRWDGCAEIAQIMAKLLPDNPCGHFHLAFALHELKRTGEAYEVLRPVVDKFPGERLMRFNWPAIRVGLEI